MALPRQGDGKLRVWHNWLVGMEGGSIRRHLMGLTCLGYDLIKRKCGSCL